MLRKRNGGEKMFNDEAFRWYCNKRGFKLCKVAEAMGMRASTLYRKRKGELEFTLGEMQDFISFSGETIDSPEMINIFFAQAVA
jgi:transcriptional regulator with XRE-family HTH domain